MQTQHKLTPRQWRLYEFIKFRTLSGSHTDKEDICNNIELYKLEVASNSIKNCPAIYNDIKALNNSCEIEKIIVVDRNKIYLGDEQDCLDYAEKLKNKALKLWLRASTLKTKAYSNGQGKLVSAHGDIITEESKARLFVEAFVKKDLGMEENNDNSQM